jgi:hypothetical protein
LFWPKAWLKKNIPLESLLRAFLVDDDSETFIIEFKKKTLLLKMPTYEFPFDAAAMVGYFSALSRKMNEDHNYLPNAIKLLKDLYSPSAPYPFKPEYSFDDSSSVASGMTISTQASRGKVFSPKSQTTNSTLGSSRKYPSLHTVLEE